MRSRRSALVSRWSMMFVFTSTTRSSVQPSGSSCSASTRTRAGGEVGLFDIQARDVGLVDLWQELEICTKMGNPS